MRPYLPLVFALTAGALIGLGGFTFVYAKGFSYLRDDPAACANCHVMSEHFAAWEQGGHRHVATCNDCHTPHDLVGKYLVKARNGFWHSFYFTTGRYPDPLRITPPNHEVTEEACRYCHMALTQAIDHGAAPAPTDSGAFATNAGAAERLTCTRCHRYVGHWVR
jgi:cytochrome c nitrite reductase small subunit